MDLETKQYIDEQLRRLLMVGVKKYGDTPTDANQLTPKKYVDAHASTPAGSNGDVQFNNGGAFGADTTPNAFNYDAAAHRLKVTNIQNPYGNSGIAPFISTADGLSNSNLGLQAGVTASPTQNGNIALAGKSDVGNGSVYGAIGGVQLIQSITNGGSQVLETIYRTSTAGATVTPVKAQAVVAGASTTFLMEVRATASTDPAFPPVLADGWVVRGVFTTDFNNPPTTVRPSSTLQYDMNVTADLPGANVTIGSVTGIGPSNLTFLYPEIKGLTSSVLNWIVHTKTMMS